MSGSKEEEEEEEEAEASSSSDAISASTPCASSMRVPRVDDVTWHSPLSGRQWVSCGNQSQYSPSRPPTMYSIRHCPQSRALRFAPRWFSPSAWPWQLHDPWWNLLVRNMLLWEPHLMGRPSPRRKNLRMTSPRMTASCLPASYLLRPTAEHSFWLGQEGLKPPLCLLIPPTTAAGLESKLPLNGPQHGGHILLLERLSGRMCHQGSCRNLVQHLLCRWPRDCNLDARFILDAQGHHSHPILQLHSSLDVGFWKQKAALEKWERK